jgi:hypothetical protein
LCGHRKYFLCAIHHRDAPYSRDTGPPQRARRSPRPEQEDLGTSLQQIGEGTSYNRRERESRWWTYSSPHQEIIGALVHLQGKEAQDYGRNRRGHERRPN